MTSLRDRTVAGVGWATIIMGTSRVVRLGSKLVLANLLVPRVFGLAALALIFASGVDLIRKMGIDDALIARQDRVQEAADTALWIHGLLGLVFYLVLYLTAPIIAWVFTEPVLVRIVRITGLIVIFSALTTVPSSLLEKDLQFRKKLLPGTVPEFAFAVVAILLATRDAGVWSIIIGEIVAAAGTFLMMWYVSDFQPNLRFNPSLARELLSFGSHITSAKLSSFTYQRLDDLAVGKVLGSSPLGYYSIAYTISNLPTSLINKLLSRVLFPTLSLTDKSGKKEAWLYAIRVLSALAIPSGVGIIVIAPEMVETLLGTVWLPAVPVIRLLGIYGISRAVVSGSGAVLKTTGHESLFGRLMVAQALLLAVLIYPLSVEMGILGASVAVIISAIPNHGGQFFYATRSLDIPLREPVSHIIRYLSASLIMAFVVLALKTVIPWNSFLQLISLVLGGIIIYTILLIIFDRVFLKDLFDILRGAHGRS